MPKGCAADLVRESGIGIVADTDDVKAIKECILNYYNAWVEGKLEFNPNRSVIEGFERKKLTEKLAEVFDKMY